MKRIVFLTFMTLTLAPLYANAGEEANKTEFGLRGGTDLNRLEENYDAVEIYLLKQLPGEKAVGEQGSLTSRLDFGAIYLEDGDDEGVMLAAGVDLILGFWGDRLELEAGFRPTWMFDHEYGDDDFGGGMQFTSHVGLAFSWRQAVLSYRLQHTSNAGIYDDNPGINLHMIGLGYRF